MASGWVSAPGLPPPAPGLPPPALGLPPPALELPPPALPPPALGLPPPALPPPALAPAKVGSAQVRFYLVCGGETTLEKERQSREHMDMIYKTIIKKGLAQNDQIVFTSGRGGKLNSTVVNSYSTIGSNFYLYTTNAPPPNDCNAVVIFAGQGNFFHHQALSFGQSTGYGISRPPPPRTAQFGELMFVNSTGNSFYQPALAHLRAKNTLFISLADYTDRAFERAFSTADTQVREKTLLSICLSSFFHAPNENYFGKAFASFFEGDWKEKTIGDFCEMLKTRYDKHPNVLEAKKNIIERINSKEKFEEEQREQNAWAAGTFPNIGNISDQDWNMFHQVEALKETVKGAGPTQITSSLKVKLEEIISEMDAVRVDVTKTMLLRPKAYTVQGDKELLSMTWRDFLGYIFSYAVAE